MIKKLGISAVSALCLTVGAASAEEYAVYGNEGPWTVFANVSSGGCFLQDRDNNGNLVQMGIRTAKDDYAFMGVWNRAASIMEPGETRDMELSIDGDLFTFEAKANVHPVSEGYHGAYMYLNNPDFIADVENGEELTVVGTGVVVDLTGTKKAIEMARACFAANAG